MSGCSQGARIKRSQQALLRSIGSHLEAWAPLAQALLGAMHALAAGVLADAQHGGGFGMAVVEHFAQQEGGALLGAQPFQQQQER